MKKNRKKQFILWKNVKKSNFSYEKMNLLKRTTSFVNNYISLKITS